MEQINILHLHFRYDITQYPFQGHDTVAIGNASNINIAHTDFATLQAMVHHFIYNIYCIVQMHLQIYFQNRNFTQIIPSAFC